MNNTIKAKVLRKMDIARKKIWKRFPCNSEDDEKIITPHQLDTACRQLFEEGQISGMQIYDELLAQIKK